MKYTAAISDTDILIDLAKAGCLGFLDRVFDKIHIPEYVYEKELKRKAGQVFGIIESAIKAPNSIYEIRYDNTLDIIEKRIKKITLGEVQDLVGPGEAHCAALSSAIDVLIIISNNYTEFEFLPRFIMLTYYEILALCVYHKIMTYNQAESIYNKVNNIKQKKSSHSFTQKHTKTFKRIKNQGWNNSLL